MSTAYATFWAHDPGLQGFTVVQDRPGKIQQYIGPKCDLVKALHMREALEKAVWNALSTNGSYPLRQGDGMLSLLGWRDGLAGVLQANASLLQLTLDEETCRLLPELVPVPLGEAVTWLDRRLPIYRILDHVAQRPVKRQRDLSLALLYQDEDPFDRLARNIRRDLQDVLRIQTFSGSELEDPRGRMDLLQTIFHEHRAVVFLGHLHRPNGGEGGWQLTPNYALLPTDLNQLLGGSRARTSRQTPWLPAHSPIPEVVFTSCCSGAWGDPVTPGKQMLFYPELFLDAGVRFFVGAWMDVLVPSQDQKVDVEGIRTLVSAFFTRWAGDPDGAVTHLYQAKQQCDDQLLTSLYQIYTVVEPDAPSGDSGRRGGLGAGLGAGDRLGDYVLADEIWNDPYARTFCAMGRADAPYLVQVLVDEWQDAPTLLPELQSAVKRLQEAGLGPGHLVPSRYEYAMWSREGQDVRQLHILVYDRPAGEQSADWSTLAARPFDQGRPDHFAIVLRLGTELSMRVADLHAKQIRHGNLSLGSFVFVQTPEGEQVLLKDAWVRQTRPGRCTSPRYSAPEEPGQAGGAEQLKYDCWSLGVILFELTTGQPPFDADASAIQGLPASLRDMMGALGHRVPEALDRVVRECLMPAPGVRPGADLVARRLLLALVAGGTYVGDLEHDLEQYILTGYRLFAVLVEDTRDLDTILIGLAQRPNNQPHYRLFEAAEHMGLIARQGQQMQQVVPWANAQQLAPLLGHLPSPDEVGAINGQAILAWIANRPLVPGELPILLIRGCNWWGAGIGDTPFAAERLLRFCAAERREPVIIIADSMIQLESELARSFILLYYPPLSPSELFERILQWPQRERANIQDVSAERAIELAERLFPSSRRQVTYALRRGALGHGAIDEHVVEARDEERTLQFAGFSTVTYTSSLKLPTPELVGLPPGMEQTIDAWAIARRAAPDGIVAQSVPRRLMIAGPGGYGKTLLARSLARRIGRPLVNIEAGRCLSGGLGQSEYALHEALGAAGSLSGAVVLLDDIDRFLDPIGADGGSPVAATLARMSAIFLHWLDALPPGIVAVMTGASEQRLPEQWRRRIDLLLRLDDPRLDDPRLDDQSVAVLDYRCAVLAALFRKFGLEGIARDEDLIRDLARETHPQGRAAPLPSPVARRAAGTPLANHNVQLATGADIEHWIAETILLHGSSSVQQPESALFWREAIKYEEGEDLPWLR